MIKVPIGAVKSRKRVGRGVGSGTACTAGRGTKGQKARSGGNIRPGFEGGQMPLYRRLPRRGFSNALFKLRSHIVALHTLEKKYQNGETVSIATLVEKKIIQEKDLLVKILANGKVQKALHIDDTVQISAGAEKRIIAAGGTITKTSSGNTDSTAESTQSEQLSDAQENNTQKQEKEKDES